MAIEFEVTDLNGVEEELRGAYVEKDGKHVFDPEKYHEMKAAPLLKKNQELLNEKKKLQESTRTLEEKTKSATGDVEKQIQERDREIANLRQQVREYSIWTPVKDLAIRHGVMSDRVDAVMTLLRTNDRFDMEDGKLVFKDRNGYSTMIKPERAFEVYLKEELPWAFEASKSGGSGAQNGTKGGGARTISREAYDAMTPAQRDKAIAEGSRIVD